MISFVIDIKRYTIVTGQIIAISAADCRLIAVMISSLKHFQFSTRKLHINEQNATNPYIAKNVVIILPHQQE